MFLAWDGSAITLRNLIWRHGVFAGINALDDFLDGLVFDDEVANVYGGENLANQIARGDGGAVEAEAASQLDRKSVV